MDPKTAVETLRNTGLSDGAIAKLSGTSQPVIYRIRTNGTRMQEWFLGQRLIELAQAKTSVGANGNHVGRGSRKRDR